MKKQTFNEMVLMSLNTINELELSNEDRTALIGSILAMGRKYTEDTKPKRKGHGHWCITSNKAYCSHCHYGGALDKDVTIDYLETVFRYCPECGAKMDEVINE